MLDLPFQHHLLKITDHSHVYQTKEIVSLDEGYTNYYFILHLENRL